MAKIIFSEFVEQELAEIWDLIAIDNFDAANRFLELARKTLNQLAQMPEMGRPRFFRHARLKHLRSFRVEHYSNYLIFYGPIPGGIEVFHILHGARDIERFFEQK